MSDTTLTCHFGRIYQAVNLHEERSIRVRLYLDHVLCIAIGHWATDVVRGQENLAEAALA